MAKYFQVKVYSQDDDYLTTWTDVVTDISFSNEINSAGGQMTFKLARNAGDYGEGSDVDFGHKVKVYVFDKEQPNGQLIFQGFISSYTPIYKDDSVDVVLLSYGAELSDYMIEGGEALEASQSSNTSYEMFGAGGFTFIGSISVAQSMTAPTTSKLSRFEVEMQTVYGYNQDTGEYYDRVNIDTRAIIRTGGTGGSGTTLGTSNIVKILDKVPRKYSFIFDPAVQLTSGSYYNIEIYTLNWAVGNDAYLASITTGGNNYGGGSMWKQVVV